jgi:DnaJ-class molecular chaperone
MEFHGKDVHVNVSLSFNEALHGTEKKITYTKEVKCNSCKGTKE